MNVGYDSKGQKLQEGDICKFTIDKKEYEGIILYDDAEYAFMFDMISTEFPSVYMHKVDLGSIEKIISVWSTDIHDMKYEGYRQMVSK